MLWMYYCVYTYTIYIRNVCIDIINVKKIKSLLIGQISHNDYEYLYNSLSGKVYTQLIKKNLNLLSLRLI